MNGDISNTGKPYGDLAIAAGTVLMGTATFIAAPVLSVGLFVGGTAAVLGGVSAPFIGRILKKQNPQSLKKGLMIKIREGDLEAVKKLVVENALDLNTLDEQGLLAINVALKHHQFKIADFLLEKGASLQVRNGQGFSPLTEAVSSQDKSVIEYLLFKNVDVNQQDAKGRFALGLALINNDLTLAEILWKKRERRRSNQIEHNLISPLISAAILGQRQVLQFLLLKGVPINQPDFEGNTALHGIVMTHNLPDEERLKLVRFLLERGANPEIPQNKGKTALMLAREQGDDALVAIFEHWREGRTAARRIDEAQRQKVLALNHKIQVIKEMGHILGLNTQVQVIRDDNKEPIEIPTEGLGLYEASKLFASRVEEYSDKHLTLLMDNEGNSRVAKTLKRFQAIGEAADEEADYLSLTLSKKEGSEILFTRYKTGNITFVPCASQKHAPEIALYKDMLIYADRKETLEGGGVKIFKLAPAQRLQITPDWIMRLYSKGNKRTEVDIVKVIEEVVDLKAPQVVLPSKPLKHNTDTLSNRKANLEGLLYVLEWEDLEKTKKSQKQMEEVALRYAVSEYNRFTTKLRNFEIERRVLEMNALQQEEAQLKEIYEHLLTEFLLLHHGQWKPGDRTEDAVGFELKRTVNILKPMDIAQRKKMILRLQHHGVDILAIALENQDEELVRLTLEGDPIWIQRFMNIAELGNRDLVLKLVAGGLALNQLDDHGRNLLRTVLVHHDMELAALLYESGARLPEPKEQFGYSLLTEAAFHNDKNVIEFLLSKHHDINEVDKEGRNALSVALEQNNVALANMLWDFGARPSEKVGKLNYSLLTFAAFNGDLKTLQFLASKNLDFQREDAKGRTALSIAQNKGYGECVALLEKEIAKDQQRQAVRGRTEVHGLVQKAAPEKSGSGTALDLSKPLTIKRPIQTQEPSNRGKSPKARG